MHAPSRALCRLCKCHNHAFALSLSLVLYLSSLAGHTFAPSSFTSEGLAYSSGGEICRFTSMGVSAGSDIKRVVLITSNYRIAGKFGGGLNLAVRATTVKSIFPY